MRAFRADVPEPIRNRFLIGLLVVLLTVHLRQCTVDYMGSMQRWARSALLGVGIPKAAELVPGGVLTLWGVSLLVLFVGYRLAPSQLPRMEATKRRACP